MPEMSFGRSIKFRRTKLGLSQARLGELVGRSAGAVRTWEKDSVIPNDPAVIEALAAVLDFEPEVLFEKAGVEPPAVEASPTMEQVLGTLIPETPAPSPSEIDEAEDDETPSQTNAPPLASQGIPMETVGMVSTAPSMTYTIPAPPVPEPTYVEDESQKQLYRIRHLATLVAVVALMVMFIWALGRGWSEFGAWWDGFIGTLQL